MAGSYRKLVYFLKQKLGSIHDTDAVEIIKKISEKNSGKLLGMKRKRLLQLAKPLWKPKLKEIIAENKLEYEKEKEEKDRNSRTCTVCFMLLTSKQAMKRHIVNVHQAKNFECEKCEKKFNSQESLDMHMISSLFEKDKHVCKTCSKEYKHKKDLDRHTRIHDEESSIVNISCDECGKVFTRKSNLYKHRGRKHGLYYLNFEKARKVLKTEDGSFECKICHEKFAEDEWNKLDTHLVLKECLNSESLNDDSLFQCQNCEKAYQDKNSLQRHMKLKHHYLKSLCCDLCDFVSAYKSSLARHVKKAHVAS